MHSAAFSVDVPEILPPFGRLDDKRGDRKLCVLRGDFRHYKDTKLKSESQVFRDIFFKKMQSESRFYKT